MSRDPAFGGLGRLLGMRPGVIGDGRCSWALTVRPDHLNPYGTVHGGVVYALVDQAMGGALFSRLEPGERCATLEIKINYLTAVTSGDITAEASLIQRTRRTALVEARVQAEDAVLIAHATGTFYIQS